ncbi:MAG: hypothetical protein WAP23_00250, partial [Candidatus Spechtbacterales bacterium]
EALKFAKADAETRIHATREELARFGRAIEEKQRDLADVIALGKKLEEAVRGNSDKTAAEMDREFEILSQKEGVRAFRVTPSTVEVFTETIFIDRDGEKFEIGDFNVTAQTSEKGKVIVRNLRNTWGGRRGHPFDQDGSFCFGVNADKVNDALIRRDFLPLITFILEALQSSNGLDRKTLMNWRLVKEGGV